MSGQGRRIPHQRGVFPAARMGSCKPTSTWSLLVPVHVLHRGFLCIINTWIAVKLAEHLARHSCRSKLSARSCLHCPAAEFPSDMQTARLLDAPLEVFIVRKIGVPGHPEVAMGALASGGIQVLDGTLIRQLRVPPHAVDAVIAEEMQELARREERYHAGSAPPLLRGRTVILVDDGLATGQSMRAAVRAARKQQPMRIVVAAPVGSRQAVGMLEAEADEVVCLLYIQNRSVRWDCGTRGSDRRPTTKSASCWDGPTSPNVSPVETF